jgi:tetratricopeptide (TPR) repeat protein
VAIAGVLGVVLVIGSLLPASGVANSTAVNEALAATEAAEVARQAEISRLLDDLAANAKDPETLSGLADAYLAGTTSDDLARAAAALQVLIALEPDRADAYERLIGAYVRAGDFTNARRALDSYQAIERPDPVEVAFLDGVIALRGEDDPERAMDAFDAFLELAPDDARAPMVRGLRAEAEEAAAGS